jgi:serine protease SohB
MDFDMNEGMEKKKKSTSLFELIRMKLNGQQNNNEKSEQDDKDETDVGEEVSTDTSSSDGETVIDEKVTKEENESNGGEEEEEDRENHEDEVVHDDTSDDASDDTSDDVATDFMNSATNITNEASVNGTKTDISTIQDSALQQSSLTPSPPSIPSMPSMIFIPPPFPSSPRANGATSGSHRSMPGTMPVSPTEATLNNVVVSVVPLIVRLLLATLLSHSSIFGHGDSNVYSPEPTQHFIFERINDRYYKDNIAMKKALEHPPSKKSKHAWNFVLNRRRNEMKKKLIANTPKVIESMEDNSANSSPLFSRTIIVIDVDTLENNMDTTVENLRDAVTCILRQYNSKTRLDMGTELEIVLCIESPGGIVQDFGLAADQITRLKEAGEERGDLIVTVCVDKIAASGGYMMACQASPGQLIAAPFAILGSIGVLRETINIHDVLEKYGVRPLLMTAGDAKAPLTQTTKVTEESLEFVQNNLDRVHDAFREMVSNARNDTLNETNFEKVTDGDIFLGKDAFKYGLVDKIMSSDEYILDRLQAGDRVLRLHKYDRSGMGMRFSPLDLLLLKSNGMLGKNLVKQLNYYAKSLLPVIFQCSTTYGAMKIMDKSIVFARRRNFIDDI